MGVENVVCPDCGKEALATIPSGQYLIRIDRSNSTKYNNQHCRCPNCGYYFYAVTWYDQ